MRIASETLRKLIGGVRFCREEELTREVLLEFLKSQGEIEDEGLGGGDCADDGGGELWSDIGRVRRQQQQCSCSESGDRGGGRCAASPAGAFHAGSG